MEEVQCDFNAVYSLEFAVHTCLGPVIFMALIVLWA